MEHRSIARNLASIHRITRKAGSMSNDATAASTEITAAPPAPVVPSMPPRMERPATVRGSAPDGRWTAPMLFLAGLALIFAFIEGGSRSMNSDIWLNLATGRLMAEGNYQFGVDPFTWGSEGEWINSSWLFSWSIYKLYVLAGTEWLGIVKAILAVGLVLLVFASKPRDGSPLMAIEIAALVVLTAGVRWFLQPVVFSCVAAAATMVLLYRGGAFGGLAPGSRASKPALWSIPILFAVWANVDSWVFLGPLMLLLTLLASLAPLPRHEDEPTTSTFGLLLLAGIVGCMLNPHHVRVFQLPADLAYAIYPVGKLLLPKWMMASGEGLDLLQRTDPALYATFSPVSPDYLSRRLLGLNISGLALFPLILLNLGSFFFSGLRSPGSLARLFISVVVVVFGLLSYRIVPIYASVVGPIILWNAADFARRRTAEREPILQPSVARLLAAFLLLLGIAFAWPGFLHGQIGNYRLSQRRFDLAVYADPSLKDAAIQAEEAAKKGKTKVFNFHHDVANFLAWFAPSTKSYQDGRMALFPKANGNLLKINQSLKTEKDESWRETLNSLEADQVMMSGIRWETEKGNTYRALTAQMLLTPRQFRLAYADGRTLDFVVGKRSEEDDFVSEWNKEVFETTLPAPALPAAFVVDLDPLTQYVQGYPPLARPNAIQFIKLQAQLAMQREGTEILKMSVYRHATWMAGSFSYGPYMSMAARTNFFATDAAIRQMKLTPPPAAGIVMLRSARQAAAENPLDRASYDAIGQAVAYQSQVLESEWVALAGHQSTGIRAELRQLQMIAAIRSLLELDPSDAFARASLADAYHQTSLIDAAVQQLDQSIKNMPDFLTVAGNPTQQIRDAMEMQKKKLAAWESDLKKRRDDYDLRSATVKGMKKFRHAFAEPYRTTVKDREKIVGHRGLALEALAQLNELKSDGLPPQEKWEAAAFKVKINLMLGNIPEAMQAFDKEDLGPNRPYIGALLAGTIGDYKGADAFLEEMESQRFKMASPIAQFLAIRGLPLGLPAEPGIPLISQIWQATLARDQSLREYATTVPTISDLAALRGILKLEIGQPQEALARFQRAHAYVGDYLTYPDQPIAERYQQLLELRQKKK
jgi:tetratricopeptide (TPR) repeat protein